MEDKDLERFVAICNLKFRLKATVESLGFENKNGVLFVKPDAYDVYAKFDDNEMIIWSSANPRKKISRYYSIMLKDIKNEIYTEKEIVESVLNLLSGI